MTAPGYSSFKHWYSEGRLASYVRSIRSPGGILSFLEAVQPAGDMSDPAVPDLILYQDLIGGSHVALEVGYSLNQVLARVFVKHRHMSPSDYRRAVRDPARQISLNAQGTALAAAEARQ